MLEAVLLHLKNWFLVPNGVHEGTYTIENGALAVDFLQNGQYYRICGSVFNDGLHKYGDSEDQLTNETFTGTIWALAVPKRLVELSEEIQDWQTQNGKASQSPFTSESFGGYSYSKATDAKTGGAVTWQAAFRQELNEYRKVAENGPVEPWRGYAKGYNPTDLRRRVLHEPY